MISAEAELNQLLEKLNHPGSDTACIHNRCNEIARSAETNAERAKAHLILGLYHHKMVDPKAAITHLDQARRYANSGYELRGVRLMAESALYQLYLSTGQHHLAQEALLDCAPDILKALARFQVTDEHTLLILHMLQGDPIVG